MPHCDACNLEVVGTDRHDFLKAGLDAAATCLCQLCRARTPSSKEVARRLNHVDRFCIKCDESLEPGMACAKCALPSWIDWLGLGDE